VNRFVRILVVTALPLALLAALAHGSPALADDSTDAAASAAFAGSRLSRSGSIGRS
jgi:hypothetical protein